jgi:hypothetical protein
LHSQKKNPYGNCRIATLACPGYTISKKIKIITVDFFNENLKFASFFNLKFLNSSGFITSLTLFSSILQANIAGWYRG